MTGSPGRCFANCHRLIDRPHEPPLHSALSETSTQSDDLINPWLTAVGENDLRLQRQLAKSRFVREVTSTHSLELKDT
jgi:hypothetical protein